MRGRDPTATLLSAQALFQRKPDRSKQQLAARPTQRRTLVATNLTAEPWPAAEWVSARSSLVT